MTRDSARRIPFWARPLVILAGPYLAAGTGWAIATLINWCLGVLG